MAGFSGLPSFGGQYNNPPYGAPFQQNPPGFNNIIPPPPHHYNQQQTSFPSNYPLTTPQQQYVNQMAYQHNSQYPPPQQFPQPVQIPLPPPPPFFNNYNGYSNSLVYGNVQDQHGGHSRSNSYQGQPQVPQDQSGRSYAAPELYPNTKQHPEVFNSTLPLNQSSLATLNPAESLARLETPAQDDSDNLHLPTQTTDDRPEHDMVVSSGNESSAGQTPMQLDSATTNRSEPVFEGPSNAVQSSQSSSEESFDPYSMPAFQSLDGANEAIPFPLPPQQQQSSTAGLPGINQNVEKQPVRTQLENDLGNIHQQRKVLAIQAIQDLASRKVGFDQISKEDIDNDLLKQLYLESGVPMASSTISTVSQPLTTTSEPVALQTKALFAEGPIGKTISAPADPPTITAVPNFNLPLPAVVRTVASASIALPSDASEIAPQLVKEASLISSSPAASSRQEYLAKLQAAKAAANSKAPSVSSATSIQDRSTYLARLQAAKEAVKPALTTKSAAEPPQASPIQNMDTQNTANTNSIGKANIDALIRQKLEALKKTKSANTAADSQAETLNDLSTVSADQSGQEHRPASSGQAAAIAKLRTPIRTFSADNVPKAEVSFFSPTTRKGFVGGIPGLPGLASTSAIPTVPHQQFAVSDTDDEVNGQQIQDKLEVAKTDKSPVIDVQNTEELPYLMVNQQSLSQPHSSRKRAVAADFINPAPPKLQQTVPSGPISLVIDVSDEEDEQGETVDDLIRNAAINEHHAVTDPPLLSRASTRSISYNTPPKVATPDLQAKEDEIRELKQRIIAATRRKTGKVTPGTPSFGLPEKPTTANAEQAKKIEDQHTALKNGIQELSAQEKALAAAKLQAQRRLEQIRRNQANLNVHAYRAQQDLTRSDDSLSRQQSVQRKAELEARLPILEETITATETDLANIQKEQQKLLDRMQQEIAERATLMNELKTLLQNLEAETKSKARNEGAGGAKSKAVTIDAEVLQMQPLHLATPITTDKQPSERQTQNPSGLSSDQPLRILSSGSNSPSRPASTGDKRSSSGEILESDRSDDDKMHIDGDSDDDDGGNDVDDDDNTENIGGYDPDGLHFTQPPVYQAEGLEESENADSQMDEYEPSQEMDAPLPSIKDVPETAVEQFPTSDRLSLQTSSVDLSIDSESLDNIDSQHDKAGDTSDDVEGYDPPTSVDAITTQRTVTDPSDTESASTAISNEESGSAISLESERQSSEESAQRPTAQEQDAMGSGGALEDEAAVNRVPSYQHFVPYESVLRQFGSYRFHPGFTQNVASGFRSLTFSHNINPKIEMCRWELAGGICSDARCPFQHFKDIELTDNNLLLQLGSVTEGKTVEEKEKYIAGLRETINGMRSRGLKDVDSIAAEIVAYRRSFLGDPSRIVANLNVS